MDKNKIQKIKKFLIELDEKIKQMKEYLAMEMGSPLLEAIALFEEENRDILQRIPQAEEELNRRKQIVQCLLFPILSDNEVKEVLEHHLMGPLEVGLDLEELMKMRAISTSELIWPKLSQEYLQSLLQNNQVLGGESLIMQGKKDTFLPYLKNWIALYNYRFGVGKHGGLEPHQFILEDPNARKLSPPDKENLLKVLKFYESLKVFSLSEIETEMKKIPLGAYAGTADNISRGSNAPRPTKTVTPPKIPQKTSENSQPPLKKIVEKNKVEEKEVKKIPELDKKNQTQKPAEIPSPLKPKIRSEAFFQDISTDNRIKFIDQKYEKNPKPLIIEKKIDELFEKYPALENQKITLNNIRQTDSPLGSLPSLKNWINYYFDKTKKKDHIASERKIFLKNLKNSQNLSETDLVKLENLFTALDEKTPVSFDQNNQKILLEVQSAKIKNKT